MKNLLKTSVSLLLLTGVLHGASESDLNVRKLDKVEWSEFVKGTDTVMMSLYYVGATSEAVVTITDSFIRGFAPAGTADTNFGVENSSYSFATSSSNTIGEICDLINALANYNCTLRAARHDDPALYLRDQTAASGSNDLKFNGGFDVQIDTGATVGGATSRPGGGWLAISHIPPSGKRAILKKCNFYGSAGGTDVTNEIHLKVYGKLRQFEGSSDGKVRNNSTLAWGPIEFASATAQTWNFDTTSGGSGIELAVNEPLLVFAGPKSTATIYNQGEQDYLSCSGEDE